MPYLLNHMRRQKLVEGDKSQTEAEKCFCWYHYFLEEWKKNDCWNTAHRLQMEVDSAEINKEDHAAKQLAWFEFYRRVIAKYEDEKIKSNGDVT
jgi:hypothetical protein